MNVTDTWYKDKDEKNINIRLRSHCSVFVSLRIRFAPFSLMKTLSVHSYPFSNEYDLNTVSVHTTPTKTLLVPHFLREASTNPQQIGIIMMKLNKSKSKNFIVTATSPL